MTWPRQGATQQDLEQLVHRDLLMVTYPFQVIHIRNSGVRDTVKHLEMNRSTDVIGAVGTLTVLRIPKDPHKGPLGAGASMKHAIHEFGSKSGNTMYLTRHWGL